MQIGIGRDAVVAGLAAEGIGMDGDIAAAGIEQHAAFDAAIDRMIAVRVSAVDAAVAARRAARLAGSP